MSLFVVGSLLSGCAKKPVPLDNKETPQTTAVNKQEVKKIDRSNPDNLLKEFVKVEHTHSYETLSEDRKKMAEYLFPSSADEFKKNLEQADDTEYIKNKTKSVSASVQITSSSDIKKTIEGKEYDLKIYEVTTVDDEEVNGNKKQSTYTEIFNLVNLNGSWYIYAWKDTTKISAPELEKLFQEEVDLKDGAIITDDWVKKHPNRAVTRYFLDKYKNADLVSVKPEITSTTTIKFTVMYKDNGDKTLIVIATLQPDKTFKITEQK